MSDQLQAQLNQHKMQIDGLTAQCDAARQTINEYVSGILALRTNLILTQKAHQEAAQKVDALNKQIETLKAQVVALTPAPAETPAA